MSHNESISHVLGMNTNMALVISALNFGMDFAISTASLQGIKLTCKFYFSIPMEVNISTPIITSLSMDQRRSSRCTLDNYNNLLLVLMQWHTSMEDLSPLMTMTMIAGAMRIVTVL